MPAGGFEAGREVATVVMLAIAAPALGIRLAYPAIDAPADLPVVSTVHAIQAAFPQSPAPAEVVVTGQHLGGPAVTSAIGKLEALAATSGPVREPVTATYVADGRALIVSVPLAGDGGDSASHAALEALRDQILPRTFGGTGVSYAVAGDTAANTDNTSQLSARTPLVLAVVAAVAFCLLLLSFRSVVLPLVSIALNFLSVAAAYGLITVIFQDGRLQGLLGYASSGAIIGRDQVELKDARGWPGGGHLARRHDRPRRPPPRGHDHARRPLLVPAQVATRAPDTGGKPLFNRNSCTSPDARLRG